MKKILALASLLLCSLARADIAYQSVEEFIESEFARGAKFDLCHVSSDYPTSQRCSVGTTESQARPIVAGLLASRSEGTAFVVVLTRHTGNHYHLTEKSAPFPFGQLADRWIGVEALSVEANDRFRIQFKSNPRGLPDRPNSDLYRFKAIDGQWRVIGLDHSGVARCDDGSYGDGDSYSANFVTGKVLIGKVKDCQSTAVETHRVRFPAFKLSDFVPLDSRHRSPASP
jgi:hypothetical protein